MPDRGTRIPDRARPTARVPMLYYSTWGRGAYAQQWLGKHNAWMYSLLAFIEANLDLDRDRALLPMFERLTASDYPFICQDATQQAYAEKTFLRLYSDLMAALPVAQPAVLSVVPIDPFLHYLSYVAVEPHPARLEVTFLGAGRAAGSPGESTREPVTQVLEPEHMERGGLHIYHRRLLLYPEAEYRVRVPERGVETLVSTMARGMPFTINADLTLSRTYSERALYSRLAALWGHSIELPTMPRQQRQSKGIYRRQELEEIMPAPLAAGIFKYNKETYSLLRFGASARLRPSVVFDDQLALDQASEYIHAGGMEIPVCNRLEDIGRFAFDAVVLTGMVNFESEAVFVRELLHHAAVRGLPVVSLYGDALAYARPDDRERLEDRAYQIMVPAADAEALLRVPAHVDPRKTLGVFGTDSVQGKFTIQIYLHRLLGTRLRVRHLPTEPTGILVGSDINFFRVEGGGADQEARVRRALVAELQADADLVITGGQGGLAAKPEGRDRTRNPSTAIFRSVQPGWVILTVAVDTPLVLIQETLAYLDQLAADSGHPVRVVAFAMLGGRKLRGSRWTQTYFLPSPELLIQEARTRITEVTGIPVFLVPEEIEALAEAVLRCL